MPTRYVRACRVVVFDPDAVSLRLTSEVDTFVPDVFGTVSDSEHIPLEA